MVRSERIRIVVCGASLLLLALVVFARLAWLQVAQHDVHAARVDRLRSVTVPIPAAAGAIFDRKGRALAHDRPVYEVRGEWSVDLDEKSRLVPGLAPDLAGRMAADLAVALSADPWVDDPELPTRLRATLANRILAYRPSVERDQVVQPATDTKPLRVRRRGFFLVADAVDSKDVLDRLRALADPERRPRPPYRLHLHFELKYARTYPHGDLTIGPIGFVGQMATDRGTAVVRRGFERMPLLLPGADGSQEFQRDARARRYWARDAAPPESASVLHTTIDLDLQRIASEELESAVQRVAEDFGSPPEWGAMIVVEVATGDVVAMTSHAREGSARGSAFAPMQKLYEPGSVVKPMLFALALEAGRLNWTGERIDCTPNMPGNGWRVPNSRRVISDVTRSGMLLPPEILMRSSNIGAVQVGRRLDRATFVRYVERFEFGRSTQLGLPEELEGTCQRDFERMRDNTLLNWSGPSVSIGYEMAVTPVQVVRAYLTLLSWRPRSLRLIRGHEIDGTFTPNPVRDADTTPFPHPEHLELLRAAMIDVVSLQPGATGKPLAEYLKREGYPDALIAGKSGSSRAEQLREGDDGQRRPVRIHSASFVGFAPAHEPRYLAMCVVQREAATTLHGGKYAALATGKTLLRALARTAVAETGGASNQARTAGTARTAQDGTSVRVPPANASAVAPVRNVPVRTASAPAEAR